MFKTVDVLDIKEVKSIDFNEVDDILTEKFIEITEEENSIITSENISISSIVDCVVKQHKEDKIEEEDKISEDIGDMQEKTCNTSEILEKLREIKDFAVLNNLNVVNEIMKIKARICSLNSNLLKTKKTILDYLNKL